MARIVRTVGPRGYRPQYGVTEDGAVIELYSGPPIKIENSGSSEIYNWDFLNINESNLPFVLSNLGKYSGNSDSERILWLQDQMKKMEAVAKIYAGKIKEISEGEPDLAKVVSSSLVLVGGKLLTAAPPAGAIVAGVGLIIQFLSSSRSKEILEFKTKKVLEWSAIIQVLQKQYKAYQDEIDSINMKSLLSIVGVLLVSFLIYQRVNG